MNEFIEQYWSFYNAGVTVFLFAGLALVIKLLFFKRKRHKRSPTSHLNIGIIASKMISDAWKKNFMLSHFCLKKRLRC